MFSVVLRQDEYFVYMVLSIQILLDVDKVRLQSLETHPALSLIHVPLQTLAWDAALIKAFTSWLKRSLMTRHLCSKVVRHITGSYLPILMQFLMSFGRHSYFICLWHLHLSFAARFSNMPYFRQSLSRNAITKFYQIWYISPNTAY